MGWRSDWTIDKWGDDIIDSRDIIARVDELEGREDDEDDPLDEDETEELAKLREIVDEGENCEDWNYGATLVHERYFTRYAEQFADDIGAIDSKATWPLSYIDWEAAAEALKQDFYEFEVHGETYFGR